MCCGGCNCFSGESGNWCDQTGDAYNISIDEKSYTKCFDNDKKSVKANEECVKVDTLIQKEETKTGGTKKHVETVWEAYRAGTLIQKSL